MTCLDNTGRVIFAPDPHEAERVAQAKALKASHLARLDAVIEADAFVCTTNRAKSLRRKIAGLDPEFAGGMLGENGHGPAVDDVCSEAAYHGRVNRERALLKTPTSRATTGRLDQSEIVERVMAA